jgi:hypothetical protein
MKINYGTHTCPFRLSGKGTTHVSTTEVFDNRISSIEPNEGTDISQYAVTNSLTA